jgi:hypothetical protein
MTNALAYYTVVIIATVGSFIVLAQVGQYYKKVTAKNYELSKIIVLVLSCKIFEHFALQVDPVIGFIQPRPTPFKESTILVPKLADSPFWWKSNSTTSKTGSGLPDPD